MRQIFSWLSGASPAHCAGKEALESSDAEQQGGEAAESSSEAADESSSQSTSESSSPPSSSTFAPDEEEKATAWAGAALPSRATRPRWLPQPGPFDSFMMDSMGVMMFPTFDGFELAMTNQIGASATNMFRVVHTVKLGNSQCENGVDYTFAPQVMFGDQTDRNASQTWLVGNTDLGNVVSGRVIHAAGANELSLDLQLTHRNSHNMLKWSHTGEDHSFGLKFGGSPETTTYLGGDYCQSITKNWSLGHSLFFVSAQDKVMGKFGARRKTKDNVLSLMCECDVGPTRSSPTAALQQMTLKAGYTANVSRRLSLACQYVLRAPRSARETEVSAGYRYRLKQSKLQGKLDSHGTLATYLEHRTVGLPLTLLFSAVVDYSSVLDRNPEHSPTNFSFGYGLRFGE